jgi:hypothetical protein
MFLLSLKKRLYRLSHRAAAENSNPTDNQPGERKTLEEIFIIVIHLISSF